MTVFYLIRHGAIVWMPGDPGLSNQGRTQAAGVAAFLKDKDVQRVYTSPLLRARQTAEIIALALGVPLEVDSRLRERLNWGDVLGISWEVFAEEFRKGDLDRDYISPGGVSARQAGARFAEFLAEAAQRHTGQSIAVVTHGGILADYLIDHLPAEVLAEQHAGWPILFKDVIKHCSITTLEWARTGARIAGLAVTVSPA